MVYPFFCVTNLLDSFSAVVDDMLRGLGIICNTASANSRKDKSLRIMSQKFVMLFLVSKTKIVTLDVAAKILIEETQDTVDHSKFKSKLTVER